MITYYKIQNNKMIETLNEAECIWIHLEKPDINEIKAIKQEYQLPLDYLTDILDDNENSRFEVNSDSAETSLTLLQFPKKETKGPGITTILTYPFAIILTANQKIITASNHQKTFLNTVLSQDFYPERLIQQLFYAFVFNLSKKFNYYLEELRKASDELEDELLSSSENRPLHKMVEIKKSLVFFEESLRSNVVGLTEIYDGRLLNNDEFRNQIFDCIIESKQALSSTRVQMKLIDNVSDIFSSIVSNNLNIVMKILTSLTIVLTIPTIVGGFYGMNVKIPGSDDPYAFYIILFGTILFCIIMIRLLKRKRLM
ncbi:MULTISPECIES: magnesium transporter CorA family protein [unclassified Enterococcus]|uniref:magnesium transporter CorA family protein n=1 Tax=unclassified Enterococcus TaxID=2608891 RepID=UPI0015536E71|nr:MULTISPECIES: magnesium transporter CorA family protein [unclassified Enterococcus]MBS7576804.1 magnesium transporter CorA family protein [Enterococcus sp. MMGLQ5-2]MBS7584211.1 magnesium transporter CorA family protein [Enterococcus sp. MMGLQ5-1]NPD12067.1 magnesium transporter CorA family protein [Enterococcus sp. MMGLQ5-1]NPD36639.1 magnesium transporter CorA family protein [Enterococcus sp. MMGLQ5-2]